MEMDQVTVSAMIVLLRLLVSVDKSLLLILGKVWQNKLKQTLN